MIEGQTAPLEIARRILKPETVYQVRRREFTNMAYLILDRWALNTPDMLLALEARDQSAFMLCLRLEQQVVKEREVLESDEAWEMGRRGMSDWEVLEIFGIDTELRSTRLFGETEMPWERTTRPG